MGHTPALDHSHQERREIFREQRGSERRQKVIVALPNSERKVGSQTFVTLDKKSRKLEIQTCPSISTQPKAGSTVDLQFALAKGAKHGSRRETSSHEVRRDFLRRRSPTLIIHYDAQGKSRGTSALRVRTLGNARRGCGSGGVALPRKAGPG